MSDPSNPDPLKLLDERIKAAKMAKTPEPKVDDHYTGAQLAWRMVIELVAGIAIGFGIGYGLDALFDTLPVFLVLSETTDYSDAPLLVGLWVAFVGLLMISTLKTLSPKGLRVPRKLIAVMIFAMVIVIGMVFTRPWTLLVVIDLAYLAILSRSLVQARGRFFN